MRTKPDYTPALRPVATHDGHLRRPPGSVSVTYSVMDRLNKFAHTKKVTKGSIADVAIDLWLKKQGY